MEENFENLNGIEEKKLESARVYNLSYIKLKYLNICEKVDIGTEILVNQIQEKLDKKYSNINQEKVIFYHDFFKLFFIYFLNIKKNS